MEDCCVVCAEPLEWVAYGHCGHKDACSKCVARLRFVLDDKRCVICQQTLLAVFVTKFLGAYTKALPAAEIAKLGERDSQVRSWHLRSIDAFFDDKSHFEGIRQLCSYTHPRLAEADTNGDQVPTHFRNLGLLKKAIQQHLHLQFCNICLEGRKVFISEQLLYNGRDLAQHQHSGDIEGVLAESGFKGHPMCRFCNKRFFGENELFFHMQHAHEQCHICKKQHPDRFVYYRDYNELEEHFRREHFLCGHTQCLEQKFVVFGSEQELRQHNAREHAGTMTRAERRQAMTIPIDIQYSRRQVEEQNRGRPRGNVRLREPDPHQLATALQASMNTANRERTNNQQGASSSAPRLDESDFPNISGEESMTAFAPGFSSFAQARGQAPKPEDFPALPTLSKSQKRRDKAKEKEKEEELRSLAQRIGRQGQVKVLNSGGPNGNGPRPEAFPALASTSVSNSRPLSPNPQWQKNPSSRTLSPEPKPTLRKSSDFPSLPQAPPKKAPIQVPKFSDPVQKSNPNPNPPTISSQNKGGLPKATKLKKNDFPALSGQPNSSRIIEESSEDESSNSRIGPSEPQSDRSRGMSEALKTANKNLLEKVKKQLSPKKFGEFRQSVGSFMRGEIDARQYHSVVESLGLSNLIPEMASLLPDPKKRSELLKVHESAASTSTTKSYIPPEALSVALRAARSQGSWECEACTLINEPKAAVCEACGSKRPLPSLGTLTRPKSGTLERLANGNSGPSTNGSKSGPKKVSKFERLRVTSGGQDTAFQDEVDRRTKPQNAWTHKHSLTGKSTDPKQDGAWGPPGSKSAWGS